MTVLAWFAAHPWMVAPGAVVMLLLVAVAATIPKTPRQPSEGDDA